MNIEKKSYELGRSKFLSSFTYISLFHCSPLNNYFLFMFLIVYKWVGMVNKINKLISYNN